MTGDKYDRSGAKTKVSAMVIDANDPMILFYLSKFLPYKNGPFTG